VASVKLDENVPDSVGTILREAGHDVALARQQGLAGAPDSHVLAVAAAEDRVLVTFDRGFTNVIQHPPAGTAGIVVIRLANQALPLVRKVAGTLARLLATEPTRGRLWIVDDARLRIWPKKPA
jgi:predicted nuclease of predicted toxin-antitoxin system